MTQDEVNEMARQAHRKLVTEVYVGHMGQLDPWTIELLKIFAKLVDAKATAREREACAKTCDEYAIKHGLKGDDNSKAQGWMMMQCAAAIRARGEA